MTTLKFSVFKLGDEELAIDSSKIVSFSEYTGKKQKLSGVPKFVLGKDDSGKILVDMDQYLDFPLNKLTQILYAKVNDLEIGFVVNEKLSDLNIDTAIISPTPEVILAKYKTHFITGIAKVDDRLIIIIDPSLVFSSDDFVKIKDASQKQAGANMFSGISGLFGQKNKQETPKPQTPQPSSQQTQQVSSQQSPSVNQIQQQPQNQVPSTQQVSQTQNQQTQDKNSQQVSPPAQPAAQQQSQQQTSQQVVQSIPSNVETINVGSNGMNSSQIQEENIVIEEDISQSNNNLKKLSKLKEEIQVGNSQYGTNEEEKVEEFIEKLKDDPFLKRQEEIQENLKKIKKSIEQLDSFFEQLLVREEEEGKSNYDASEEVLLSSIGVELHHDTKYLSDLVMDTSRPKIKKEEKLTIKPTEPKKEQKQEQKKVQENKPQGQNIQENKISEEEIKKREDELKKRDEEKKKRCPDNQGFGFWDGRNIHTIEELLEELKSMQDNEFYNHVNDQKNDFANWIRYAISLANIADMIGSIKQKQQLIEAFDNYFAGK